MRVTNFRCTTTLLLAFALAAGVLVSPPAQASEDRVGNQIVFQAAPGVAPATIAARS